MTLVTPEEIDVAFAWPIGKAERLARRGLLPHYRLPDGVQTIRFDRAEVDALIRHIPPTQPKSDTIPE